MTLFNITFIDNTSGPLVLAQGIVENSGQTLGGSLTLFFFLILLVLFKKSGTQNAFLASSFITTILAGILYGTGLLSPVFLTIPFTLLVVSIVMKVWGEG
jgi:inner membrane protein involved in colicin E2 resistance